MKTNLLAVLASLALCFTIGISMISPPNPGIPVLPEEVYQYKPSEWPGYATQSYMPFMVVDNHKATLGRVLFYDTRLSKLQDISCGSCHKQEFSFADNTALSAGTDNSIATRNTPNLNDLGWRASTHLFWDYRESNLKDLVVQPIENPDELGINREEVVERLKAAGFYDDLFKSAFGDELINMDRASEALAQFMHAMTTFNTKYDRVKTSFGAVKFTDLELRGESIFNSFCEGCHKTNSFETHGAAFTTNNGLDSTYANDPGKSGWADIETLGIFRSPSLRNIELTAPYMHDGRLETLEDVIDFYSEDMIQNPDLFPSPYYGPVVDAPFNASGFGLDISDPEKEALLAFLLTLTDKSFIEDPKFSNPFPAGATSTNHQPELLDDVNIFPNPAVDFVNITHLGKVNIQLFDLHGRLLFEERSNTGSPYFTKKWFV